MADDERSLERDETAKDCNGRLIPHLMIRAPTMDEVSPPPSGRIRTLKLQFWFLRRHHDLATDKLIDILYSLLQITRSERIQSALCTACFGWTLQA